MLFSELFSPLLKETPAEAELISHQLLLRTGMIRKLASGVYSWLPLGLRVLRKVEHIVREEMNAIGAQECLFPSVQPAELWVETNRWDQYGKDLLRFTDRHDRAFCYGPTHEEVVVDVMRGELKSYKQLPLTVYQIQTKFRDEIRPRFGLMRGREFIMKDAYSFNLDKESLQTTYEAMHGAYHRIFTRLGLTFRAVLADTGAIGGSYSHEFQVLAEAGEDIVAYSDEGHYAANIERAKACEPIAQAPSNQALKTVKGPLQHSATSVKTYLVQGKETPWVALILRGDHALNEIKVGHLLEVASPLVFAPEENKSPMGLPLFCFVDTEAAALAEFSCISQQDHEHYQCVNWGRDITPTRVVDIRQVVEGDLSPDDQGKLKFARGIEVGHIFQLGERYSEPMGLKVLNQDGKAVTVTMGCYGLGVSRVVAAAIEQNHDERGIIWPEAMAPFDVILLPLQMHKSYRVREVAELLYETLKEAGIAVLMDNRKERPGVLFATADLIGIPHQLIISESGCDTGMVEYQYRAGGEKEFLPIDKVLAILQAKRGVK